MNRIEYQKLSWPKGLNLDLLAEVLPEEKLVEFLVKNSFHKRLSRRIILPSSQTIKKIIFHYLWSRIVEKKTTWEKIRDDFKSEMKTLKALSITKHEAERLYKQRCKEIIKERQK